MVPPAYRLKQIALLMGDLLTFELALLPTLLIRYGTLRWDDLERHLPAFGCVALLWCVSFYINHLYELEAKPPLRLLRTYLESMLANLGIAIAVFYLLPFNIAPRTNLFLHFLISLFLGYGWRALFHRFVVETRKPVTFLYMGDPHLLHDANQLLKRNHYGFVFGSVFLPLGTEPPEEMPHLQVLTDAPAVIRAVEAREIRGLVMDRKASLEPAARDIARAALFAGIPIFDLMDLEETIDGRIPLRQLSETWLLIHLQEAEKRLYDQLKRVLDLAFSIPFGLATLVCMPILWVLNALFSPGPLLYRQERVGLHNTRFQLWKFRTMQLDAEKNGPQFSGGTDGDPRVTKIGRWLRKLRIDELPQIWNVLRGDLSVIGPRPERPEFVGPLMEQEPAYTLRHITRPGLTGWAQVTYLKPNERNEDNLTKLQYDLYYLKHRSLILDGLILLKTVGIVLRRQGV